MPIFRGWLESFLDGALWGYSVGSPGVPYVCGREDSLCGCAGWVLQGPLKGVTACSGVCLGCDPSYMCAQYKKFDHKMVLPNEGL